tara:strand:+ start:311 stop:556 length:246 start_codon:yes stop_codon:yes gene_type:complete
MKSINFSLVLQNINVKHIIAFIILTIVFYIISVWKPANIFVIVLLFIITLNMYLMKIENDIQNKFDKNIKSIKKRIDNLSS